MTFIVLCGTKNALAEQTITLGLVGAIIDGLGLQNFTIRTLQNLLRGGKSDGNLREVCLYLTFFLKSHSCILYMYPLIEGYTQTQALELVQQHVK